MPHVATKTIMMPIRKMFILDNMGSIYLVADPIAFPAIGVELLNMHKMNIHIIPTTRHQRAMHIV
ncbi:MAG: hypothetical protein CUN55_17075, partial [Phototrophicales bacterium]